MKYGEVVEFESVVDIKVLVEGDRLDRAREDVRTFVVSDRMLDQLQDVIVPNLQFDAPQNNKGLLTLGNYGTGKTHLMSVIAGISEHADLSDELKKREAADAFSPIAGHFQVIRAEIGATTMGLRDIVCRELEQGLESLGIAFSFPDLAQVTNTKDSLVDMMAAFESQHPDKALLLVLDELLDYLRGRRDAELNLDLRFLREVGEVCGSTRFRFIAGIQEAIFDNPRFANVASDVRRVKDRFEQVRISREDVAYVVKERLLRKTTDQRDRIREHLQQFTPLYEGMAEALPEFIELFPVHPAYIRTFEQITAVEKREVLKTLSREMEGLLDKGVPSDAPGLISYDTYRERLANDPSTRSIPEVREVLDKSEVLRSRIQQAMAKPQYVPVALRIIDGLSVHRLTTDDIYVPIGATRKELRDDLCLLPPNLPELEASFLETTIDAVIDQIVRAVSGQFITENPENGQVYLDVRKDIDYDQKIEDRAASLDEARLDEGYFHALEEVLERRDAPYVAGYRIWEYELPWSDHRVTRFGYLFMGAPNERSTAQPPRDFYIYFLQPYDPPKFTDEEKPDEVFFRLEQLDNEFTAGLRRYAGATALARESTATHRGVYEDKARGALQEMVSWLRSNMGEAVTVTYKGERKPLQAWLGAVVGPRGSVKDQVDTIAAQTLTPHFGARYPGYPHFNVEVTRENLSETVRQALNHIAATRKTELGAKALQSLDLLDVHSNLVDTGEFAKALLTSLRGETGKVVNRTDLLTERDPGVFSWEPWHLEPIWLLVVAAALTQLGRADIGFPGSQVDALGLDRLARMSIDELESFSHIAPPKELPVVQLRALARLLGLPSGIVPDAGVTGEGVRQLLTSAGDVLRRAVEARSLLQQGISLWGALVVEQGEERDRRLDALQKLLEEVRARDTVGKMNKLNAGLEVVDEAKRGLDDLEWVEAAVAAKGHLAEAVEYLREAAEVFGPAHSLSAEALTYRDEILDLFRGQEPPHATRVAQVRAEGESLRRRFVEEAVRAHTRDRLDGEGDERKRRVLESDLYADLRKLGTISLLPQGAFGSLESQLVDIATCKMFEEEKLRDSVVCPECGYRPRTSSGPTARAAVDAIEDQLRTLREEWVKTLLDNLGASEMQEQISLLRLGEAEAVSGFVQKQELPSPVTDAFAKALNQVFERFEVRRVSPTEVWAALFPEQAPTTSDELRNRFDTFLGEVGKGASEEKLRIVPNPNGEEER